MCAARLRQRLVVGIARYITYRYETEDSGGTELGGRRCANHVELCRARGDVFAPMLAHPKLLDLSEYWPLGDLSDRA